MGSIGSLEILLLSVLPIVIMFVVLYLVIKWAVTSALRSVSSAFREGLARDHTAREVLDERYARGETGREEYEQMRRDIRAE